MRIKNRIFLLLLAILAIYSSASLAREPAQKKQRGNVVDKLTHEVGDSDLLASRDIALLSTVYGTDRLFGFLDERLNHLRNAGPSALPALASFLNRDVWDSYGTVSQYDRIIDSLRSPATRIWYDIKWKKANESQKITTALMSINPRADVNLAPDIGAQKILALGRLARQAVYSLLSSRISYRAYPLNARRISSLLKVLIAKEFEPTQKEIDQVLQNGGEYGQFVMLSFAAKHNHYSQVWINTFKHWMKSKKKSKQYSLLLWCEPPLRLSSAPPRKYFDPSDAVKNEILNVALKSARMSVRKVSQGTASNADYLLLDEVASLAYKYKNDKYLSQMNTLNHKLQSVLEKASSGEILDHVTQYQLLRAHIRDASVYLQKLKGIQEKKGSQVE